MKTKAFYVGPSPYKEQCADIGSERCRDKARKECVAFVRQLRRIFGPEPYEGHFYISRKEDEAGKPLSVEFSYNADDSSCCWYVHKLKTERPGYWDQQAREELGLSEE